MRLFDKWVCAEHLKIILEIIGLLIEQLLIIPRNQSMMFRNCHGNCHGNWHSSCVVV